MKSSTEKFEQGSKTWDIINCWYRYEYINKYQSSLLIYENPAWIYYIFHAMFFQDIFRCIFSNRKYKNSMDRLLTVFTAMKS